MLNTIASYEYQKNKHVQQLNVFKCQTWMFLFQHNLQIYLNIYPIYKQLSECLLQKNDTGCCPSHWQTADCTCVSYANFCPPSIFSIGPKWWQSLGAKSGLYGRCGNTSNPRWSSVSQWCVTLGKWWKNGQNTALTDCVLRTRDVTMMMSSS